MMNDRRLADNPPFGPSTGGTLLELDACVVHLRALNAELLAGLKGLEIAARSVCDRMHSVDVGATIAPVISTPLSDLWQRANETRALIAKHEKEPG